MLTSRQINSPHGFFGRQGGVSTGLYASLNCGLGSGDDLAAVRENRARVADMFNLPETALCTPYQFHSSECLVVGEVPHEPARADALATDRPGLLLGILTADCAPVLFRGTTAAGRPVIAAAHAGWRGALDGVLANTVEAMGQLGAPPESISATIGPCIGLDSYEVQKDFIGYFLNDDPANTDFFCPQADGWRFDLPGFVSSRLRQVGVESDLCEADTCALENDYFSYRRTTRAKQAAYGRQLSVIAIEP